MQLLHDLLEFKFFSSPQCLYLNFCCLQSSSFNFIVISCTYCFSNPISLISYINNFVNLFVLETEYKKAKQELKKATAETHKLQKKVKKGELGERSSFETLQPMHANFKVYTISHLHVKPHAVHMPEVDPFSVAWSH